MPTENIMDTAQKHIVHALGFLDNKYIRTILIVILIIYNSAIISDVNVAISNIINIPIVKLLLVVVITCLALKDTVLAILLAIALVMSSYYSMNVTENFTDQIKNAVQGFGNSVNTHVGNAVNEAKKMLNNKSENKESFNNMMAQRNNNNPQMPNTQNMQNMTHGQPTGFNNKTPCQGEPNDRLQCTPAQTFRNELNAQGMNSVMGYNGMMSGSPI